MIQHDFRLEKYKEWDIIDLAQFAFKLSQFSYTCKKVKVYKIFLSHFEV